MMSRLSKLLTVPVNLLASLALAALLLLPLSGLPVHAAATAQTTHAYLCAPQSAGVANAGRRVVNTSTSSNTAYVLGGNGCALFAAADLGFFLSQGFTYGPSIFTLQQTAITAATTTSTSTITLPAYGYILAVVLCETAGNAVTGGVNIGDSGSATRFASAVALSANACVAVADSALTRLYVPSGVPTADQVLIAAGSSFNSASVNITIIYTYF